MRHVDWDEILAIILVAAVVITGMVLLYSTGQTNGKITERLATACIESGGTWTPPDEWKDGEGCAR